MTIEERISHLQSAAMEEARAEGNAIMKQHEDALLGVFDQHRAEILRQSETRVKAERVNAQQQLNMAMSKAQLELKRELSKTQKELKKELFEEVREVVQEYMKTEEYPRLLMAYIEKAAKFADGASMTIYINPTDEDKKEYLEEHTGMSQSCISQHLQKLRSAGVVEAERVGNEVYYRVSSPQARSLMAVLMKEE